MYVDFQNNMRMLDQVKNQLTKCESDNERLLDYVEKDGAKLQNSDNQIQKLKGENIMLNQNKRRIVIYIYIYILGRDELRTTERTRISPQHS